MIDFIRFKVDHSRDLIHEDGIISISSESGSVVGNETLFNKCFKAKRQKNYFLVSGSLHEFYNNIVSKNGLGNSNDFTRTQICDALDELSKLLGFDLKEAKPTTLEFGYNVSASLNASDLIDRVVLYNEKAPSKNRRESNIHHKEFKSREYDIKVYNKGLQYSKTHLELGISPSENLLRIETRYYSDQLRKKLKINSLEVLKHKAILEALHLDSLKKWEKLQIIDNPSQIHSDLNDKDKIRVLQTQNPLYYIERRSHFEASTVSKGKQRDKRFLESCCSKTKHRLFSEIQNKHDALQNPDSKIPRYIYNLIAS